MRTVQQNRLWSHFNIAGLRSQLTLSINHASYSGTITITMQDLALQLPPPCTCAQTALRFLFLFFTRVKSLERSSRPPLLPIPSSHSSAHRSPPEPLSPLPALQPAKTSKRPGSRLQARALASPMRCNLYFETFRYACQLLYKALCASQVPSEFTSHVGKLQFTTRGVMQQASQSPLPLLA